MRRFYYTVSEGLDSYTAGVKAPCDMCEIMKNRGYHEIRLYEYPKGKVNASAKLKKLLTWIRLSLKVKNQSCIVMQYPYNLTTMADSFIRFLQRSKGIRFIFLLHDIDSIRAYNQSISDQRERIIPEIDYLICHNEAMKAYLMRKGIASEKIYSLGIFDYLHEYNPDQLAEKPHDRNTVIIAGNLNVRKSPYLGELLKSKRDYKINLYGPNFLSSPDFENYDYHGQMDPGELPVKLEGGYGLVWDGDSLDSCSGATGKYLRYNNPHKASLYISSCIPVIVWSQAAIADYIREHRLGLTVDSLEEVNRLIRELDKEEYEAMKANVKQEAGKLTHGWYLNHVLNQIENRERAG